MHEFDALIDTYLAAVAVEGRTAKTIGSYENSLVHFRSLARELGHPEAIEDYRVEHVYEFLGALRERGVSATFQHRRQREIRAFLSWCRRLGFVNQSVFAQVPLVKLEQKVREPFDRGEVQQLLDSQDVTKYAGCRNHAIILFLLDTGIRAGECVGVELSDINWPSRQVLIRHGKGQKQRVVAFADQTADALGRYPEGLPRRHPGRPLPHVHTSTAGVRLGSTPDFRPPRGRDRCRSRLPASLPAHIRYLGD